jgi:hypothetical protein
VLTAVKEDAVVVEGATYESAPEPVTENALALVRVTIPLTATVSVAAPAVWSVVVSRVPVSAPVEYC